MREKHLIAWALLLSTVGFDNADANCKMHDAKWKKNIKPIITQPSRSDPTRLKVDWSKAIENARCADEWNVYGWRDGQTKAEARPVNIKTKTASSYIMEVDPCVGYSFAVEFVENDMMGKDKGTSATATFKSDAAPQIIDRAKENFRIGYFWNRNKKFYDVSKVSVRFPRNILKNPSCVKHIEVVGVELPKKSITVPPKKMPVVGSGIGGSSTFPGRYPGTSFSDRTTARPRYSSGGFMTTPRSSSSRYTTTNPYRWKRSPRRKTTKKPKFGGVSGARINGVAKPPYSGEFIEVTANIKACYPYKLSLKIVTPNGNTMAEISDLNLPQLAEVSSYVPPLLSKVFKVKPALSATSPATAQIHNGFGVPDTCMADFFQAVDLHMHRMSTDIELHARKEQQNKAYGNFLSEQLKEQKQNQLSRFGCVCNATLVKFNTTTAKIYKKNKDVLGVYKFAGMQNGKPYYERQDSTLHKPNALGRQSSSTSIRHKRFIGQVDHGTTPRPYSSAAGGSGGGWSHSPTPSYGSSHGSYSSNYPSLQESVTHAPYKPLEKIYYLYWLPKDKVWAVGEKMDGKKLKFRTKKKNTAKCPADPLTDGRWQSSGTLSWHDDKALKVSCGVYY